MSQNVCQGKTSLLPTVLQADVKPAFNSIFLHYQSQICFFHKTKVSVLDPHGPLPPGVTLLPSHKQKVPPPPGEDNRDVRFSCTSLIFVLDIS